MTHPTGAELRDLDLFSELADEQLEIWAVTAELHEFPAGAIIADQGALSHGVTLLLEGTAQALVSNGNLLEPVGDHVAPT